MRGSCLSYASTRESTRLYRARQRRSSEESFGSLDPETAQYHMPVEEYAAILAELKPEFIHHPDVEELHPGMLTEFGCDLEKTYFDVPRMRTRDERRLPHRGDRLCVPSAPRHVVLGAAVPAQLVDPDLRHRSGRAMAFHPRYWTRAVQNSSTRYNYDGWNKTSRQRGAARQDGHASAAEAGGAVELDPQLR